MIRNYCDVCNKEVAHRDCFGLKISPVALRNDTSYTIIKDDVCKECIDKIKVAILK